MARGTYIKNINISLLLVVFGMFFNSCSNSKNKFTNRVYHSTTSSYNVLFNGEENLKKAEEVIIGQYKDDYKGILKVSPRNKGFSAMAASGNLNTAIEKASKAIQKHSMNIFGIERNKKMDRAYLLLGKAKFYQDKYLNAIEAFNYVKINFEDSPAKNESILWAVRSQIELGNYAMAERDFQNALKNENFPKEYYGQLFAFYAEMQIINEEYDLARENLIKAIKFEKDHDKKSRYRFILGQIYQKLNLLDESNEQFLQVYKNGKPYSLAIHARVAMAQNYNPNFDQSSDYIELLNKLLDRDKNREYFHKIYYELANVYFKNSDFENSSLNARKAISLSKRDVYNKALAYELMGDIYFEKGNFKECASYYDSTITSSNRSYPNYNFLKRKRAKLDGVISYIERFERADSTLNLVGMDYTKRKSYFYNYLDSLERERKRKLEINEDQVQNKVKVYSNTSTSSFYFYNSSIAQKGSEVFADKWGGRPLRDNWRLLSADELPILLEEDEDVVPLEDDLEEEAKSDSVRLNSRVRELLSSVPNTESEVDSLKFERDYSLYSLGLIYRQQFSRVDMSINSLEDLLLFYPILEIKLPTYYYLYKNYQDIKDQGNTKKYRGIILNNYPESRYAAILNNPDQINKSNQYNVESLYTSVISNFTNQKYREAYVLSDSLIKISPDSEFIPKIELLKAMSMGYLGKSTEYIEALNYVLYSFPNDEVSVKATNLIAKEKLVENREIDEGLSSFRIVIHIKKDVDFSEFIKVYEYPIWQKRLQANQSQFDFETDVFVLHSFDSLKKATDFYNEHLKKSVIAKSLKTKDFKIYILSKEELEISKKAKNFNKFKDLK